MIALNDRVICKMANMPEKTKGGIYLPQEKVQDGMAKINIGRVEAAGPGVVLRNGECIQVPVKRGDVVVWEQYGSLRFEILGPRMVCIRSEDLGAILEKHEYDEGWFEDYAEGESPDDQKSKQVENEMKRLNPEREEQVSYQCWNNSCKDKVKMVDRPKGKDQCETCGSTMIESQAGTQVHVNGGTPTFHNR